MRGKTSRRPHDVRTVWRSRVGLAVGAALIGVVIASAFGAPHAEAPVAATAGGASRASATRTEDRGLGVARLHSGKQLAAEPHRLVLTPAGSAVFDVRKLKGNVVRRERPEHEEPFGPPDDEDQVQGRQARQVLAPQVTQKAIAAAAGAPAPSPDSSFDGLDFANWGAGHPPAENGDV